MANGKKAPWFRFFVYDWDSDFVQRSLDNAGAGIYMRLMTLQWIEGGIPVDPEMLRNYLRAPQEEWDRAWALLEAKFPVSIDGFRRNERLEEERRDMDEYLERQSENGKRGGRPKAKQKPTETQPKPTANPTQTQTKAIQHPATSNQQEEKPFARTTPAPSEPPSVYWDTEKNDLILDKDWLRKEIREYSDTVGAFLNESEFESCREALKRELLRDSRLKACLRKSDGRPSTPAKFKALASYTVSLFKKQIGWKADRASNQNGNGKRHAEGIHGLEHPRAPPPSEPVNPEAFARHQAREAERMAKRKAWREEKPPPGMSGLDQQKWFVKWREREP